MKRGTQVNGGTFRGKGWKRIRYLHIWIYIYIYIHYIYIIHQISYIIYHISYIIYYILYIIYCYIIYICYGFLKSWIPSRHHGLKKTKSWFSGYPHDLGNLHVWWHKPILVLLNLCNPIKSTSIKLTSLPTKLSPGNQSPSKLSVELYTVNSGLYQTCLRRTYHLYQTDYHLTNVHQTYT
jgi:threonine/homoserine/homoserine lactone efflux protein